MQKMDGMFYAPEAMGKKVTVVGPDIFCFAVIGMDHGHIYGMTNGLCEAGATLTWVYDEDSSKVQAFLEKHPTGKAAPDIATILSDKTVRLVASAIRPDKRAALGIQVMESGKDFFADKPGMLELEEADNVEKVCRQTGRKYAIYFSERIHVEGAVYTEQLINEGVLGRVVSVTILAPHRLSASTRPEWFFDPRYSGGILTDIGSHQLEQFLTYTGARTATVTSSLVGNYAHHEYPAFEDYGQVSLLADNGASGMVRVDWFTPDGLGAWGDGRMFIVGTKATIEVRKYLDVAREAKGDQVYLVDKDGERHICANGMTGFPFFGAFVLDCMHRTEKAITEAHTLETMRLAIRAEKQAKRIQV